VIGPIDPAIGRLIISSNKVILGFSGATSFKIVDQMLVTQIEGVTPHLGQEANEQSKVFTLNTSGGSTERYFMRYSKWYSNQDKKLVLLIIIKKIKDQFRLPRPTNSQRQSPPNAGFVASGQQARRAHKTAACN
jgi:hypothetical protein